MPKSTSPPVIGGRLSSVAFSEVSMKINFAMWSQALQGVPHISKEEWAQLDLVSRWLIATRAMALVL